MSLILPILDLILETPTTEEGISHWEVLQCFSQSFMLRDKLVLKIGFRWLSQLIAVVVNFVNTLPSKCQRTIQKAQYPGPNLLTQALPQCSQFRLVVQSHFTSFAIEGSSANPVIHWNLGFFSMPTTLLSGWMEFHSKSNFANFFHVVFFLLL